MIVIDSSITHASKVATMLERREKIQDYITFLKAIVQTLKSAQASLL